MNDPRGSLWRKWDLHVHTPNSIVNEYGGNTEEVWERFLNDLENLPPQFKVIGINDYIFIDGYRRVLKEKSNGRLNNIDLILPVIELRLDKFGGTDGSLSRVNFHIIFSNELDPEIIQEQFLNAIRSGYSLTPEYEDRKIEWGAIPTMRSLEDLGRKIIESAPSEKKSQYGSALREGFNNINFSYEKVNEALESPYFKGKFIIAVGKTEWADIKWNDQSIAEKKSIINNAGFVFIAAETADAFYKAKSALSAAGVNDRLLDCSDAHKFSDALSKDRIGNCFTWIKADPTFEGLKHVLNEPQERIFIGEIPEKLKKVSNNKTKYIKSLRIYKKSDSNLEEIWFDNCELSFNPGIVSIIGNKGMGKSALTDILALLCNCSCKDFSFLNEDKFRERKNNKSGHFEAQITWESGAEPFTRCLADDVPPREVEHVKYIPQKYFEKICNENAIGEGSVFDRELKNVIFSHVEVSDRLGCSSLDDLLDYRTSEIKDRIIDLRSEIKVINEKIVKLEEATSNDYCEGIRKLLESKRHELDIHNLNRPKEVAKPSVTIETDDRIIALRKQIGDLSSAIDEANTDLGVSKIKLASISKVRSKIENFKRSYELLKKDSSNEFENICVSFDSTIKLEICMDSLECVDRECKEHIYNLETSLNDKNPESLSNKKNNLVIELETLHSRLDESAKAYQSYLDGMIQWDKRGAEIIGNADQPNSLDYFNKLLENSMEAAPTELKGAKKERIQKVKDIYFQLKMLVDIYKDLYLPVQKFIDVHELIKNKYKLNFNVSIVELDLMGKFFNYINQGTRGTFYGAQEGRDKLKSIIGHYDLNDESNVLLALEEIMSSLENDKRDLRERPVKLSSQLKKNVKKEMLYDFLYSLEYLEPKYMLQLGEKELLRLSPGERGVLLLIFYLLVDNEDCPLIIDQPEDNLDNQSVFELVAPCIREARLRRQLFIVTHNPNLAVVCDAEQVIAASIDKANKERVIYISGAIENPLINRKIIDILEGTKPAFKKRESKYFLFAADSIGKWE